VANDMRAILPRFPVPAERVSISDELVRFARCLT
jgi:hypothetical protein